MNLHNIIFIRI